jgi:hypothetical protein
MKVVRRVNSRADKEYPLVVTPPFRTSIVNWKPYGQKAIPRPDEIVLYGSQMLVASPKYKAVGYFS